MSAGKKAAIAIGALVGIGVATVGALYLSAAIFLIANKHNPMEATSPTAFVTYWQAYNDDPALHKKLAMAAAMGFGIFFLGLPAALAALAHKTRSLHGEARFATVSEVRKAGLLKGSGIIVGKLGKQYLMLGGQLFVLLAAPTRSGKGVGVVIPNLLNWPDSVMVLDIKGENYEITAGFRAENGQKVFAFRPFNELGATHRYNPLLSIRNHPHFRVGDLQSIAAVFYPSPSRDDGEGSAKFFNEKARDLFLGLTLYLLETPAYPFTLGELLRQSSGKGKPIKEFLQTIIAERERTDDPLSEDCVAALDRFLGNSDATLSSILSTFNSPLAIFADPIVDAATSASDFSLADVRQRRTSIYVVIPPPKLPVAGLLINLLFSQLVDLNTRQLPADNAALKYQCLLLMDEFTAMGRVAILTKSVGYIAGYNLRFLTIVQSMAQLVGVYGKEEARSFSTNHALQILYAPKEQDDAKEYSDMLGTLTQQAESRGRSRSLGGRSSASSSTNVSDQRRSLMLPQELREMGQTKEIVIVENCKPILCEKIRYYQEPTFKRRVRHAPPIRTLDLNTHIARVQNRKRVVVEEDLVGGIDLSKLAHDFDSLPALTGGASAAEVAGFVDDFFNRLSVDDSQKESGAKPKTNTLREFVEETHEIDLAELER